jgi:hypothetical protein
MFGVVSIDVGLKTLSICRENYDLKRVNGLEPPAKAKRFLKDGEASDEYKGYVADVADCGTNAYLCKTELGSKVDYFTGTCYLELYKWLDEVHADGIFSDADVILIEQQMKTNHIATAIMHHLHAWLLIKFSKTDLVKLYPSKNKTRILGMSLKAENKKTGRLVKATKYQRKKWSVEQTREIFERRQDHASLKFIFEENKTKKDDLSDTVMQALAFIVEKALGKKRG